MNNKNTWMLLALSLPTLVACGGGSSSNDSNGSNDNTVKPPVVAPAPAKKPQINAKMNDTVRLNGLDIFAQAAQKKALSSAVADTANAQPFTWVISKKPAGSNSAIKNANALVTSFQPDLAGEYTIQLTATNPAATIEKHYKVTDAAENAAPNVFPAESVMTRIDTNITLSANAVDPDNNDLTYQWSVANKPSNATVTLTNETTENATFSANVAGEYELSIAVSDSKETVKRAVTVKIDESVVPYTSETSVYLNSINGTPVSANKFVTLDELMETVVLDAGSFSDNKGLNFQYNWRVVSKPTSSNAQISSNNEIKATFNPDQVGTYVFSITVTENTKIRSVDYVGINVLEAVSSDIAALEVKNSSNTIYTYQSSSYLPEGDPRIKKVFHPMFQSDIDVITVPKNGISDGYIKVDTITIKPTEADIVVSGFFDSNFMPSEFNENSDIKIEGIENNQIIQVGESVEFNVYMKASLVSLTPYDVGFNLNSRGTKILHITYALDD